MRPPSADPPTLGPGAPRAEPAQETDVWWGSYAGRTMLPSFIVCGLVILALIVLAAVLQAAFDLPKAAAHYATLTLICLASVVQLLRWAYRILTYDYRLTTRRLLVERSFINSVHTQVELRDVADVLVTQNPLGRLLGVGRIRIVTDDRGAAPLVLEGVLAPALVADKIRRARARGAAAAVHAGPTVHPAAGHLEGDN